MASVGLGLSDAQGAHQQLVLAVDDLGALPAPDALALTIDGLARRALAKLREERPGLDWRLLSVSHAVTTAAQGSRVSVVLLCGALAT